MMWRSSVSGTADGDSPTPSENIPSGQRRLGISNLRNVCLVRPSTWRKTAAAACWVVLDDPSTARKLVSRTDLLSPLPDRGEHPVAGAKDQLHYLLHQKRVLDVPSAVLETVARIDGGIVLDRASNLLAFGAILRHPELADLHPDNIEGGRTTAAI